MDNHHFLIIFQYREINYKWPFSIAMLNYQRVVRVIWQFQQFVLLHIFVFFPSLVDKKDNNGWTRPILLAKSCCLVTNPSIPDIPVAELQISNETSLNSSSADEIPLHSMSKTLIFPNISNQFPTCFTTGYGSKPWYLVNPKIAGKWMFIPLKMYL